MTWQTEMLIKVILRIALSMALGAGLLWLYDRAVSYERDN